MNVGARLKVILKELDLAFEVSRDNELELFIEARTDREIPLKFEHNKGFDHLCISSLLTVPLSNRERLEFHLAECQVLSKYQGAALIASSRNDGSDFILEIYANVFLGSMSYETVLHYIEMVTRSREAVVSLLDPIGLKT